MAFRRYDDGVIATGMQHSVRAFIIWTAGELGGIPQITARHMCAEMVTEDRRTARRPARMRDPAPGPAMGVDQR